MKLDDLLVLARGRFIVAPLLGLLRLLKQLLRIRRLGSGGAGKRKDEGNPAKTQSQRQPMPRRRESLRPWRGRSASQPWRSVARNSQHSVE